MNSQWILVPVQPNRNENTLTATVVIVLGFCDRKNCRTGVAGYFLGGIDRNGIVKIAELAS
jgi:hypothetical protein